MLHNKLLAHYIINFWLNTLIKIMVYGDKIISIPQAASRFLCTTKKKMDTKFWLQYTKRRHFGLARYGGRIILKPIFHK